MHYIVTPLVLVLLWRHSHAHYIKMRRVLVGATTIALGAYIFYPTAPPRIMDGYVDILATTSHWGWWGASASAPRGLGDLTNELAAMPSMHVGWALWCTMAIISITRRALAADRCRAVRRDDHSSSWWRPPTTGSSTRSSAPRSPPPSGSHSTGSRRTERRRVVRRACGGDARARRGPYLQARRARSCRFLTERRSAPPLR